MQVPASAATVDILNEYEILQQFRNALLKTACCNAYATNFQDDLSLAKNKAAETMYSRGSSLLYDTSTAAIRTAYRYFQQVDLLMPTYLDVKKKMDSLYYVNVFVIAFNPIEDTDFFVNKGLAPYLYGFSNRVFIDRLINETDLTRSAIPFLRLLTIHQCNTEHINPDWIVDINIQELNASQSIETKTEKQYFQEATGTDSTGRSIYSTRTEYIDRTVSVVNDATVSIQVNITDYGNGNNIFSQNFSSQYFRSEANSFSSVGSDRASAVVGLYSNIYNSYKKSIESLLYP
ncbi:MAG: hypothetical protein ABJA78_07580 [Ferruginibacter sp.]